MECRIRFLLDPPTTRLRNPQTHQKKGLPAKQTKKHKKKAYIKISEDLGFNQNYLFLI